MSTTEGPTVTRIVEDLREIYAKYPAVTNVDWFKNEATGVHTIETTSAYFDPSDEAGLKTTQTITYDCSKDIFTPTPAIAPEDFTVLLQKYSPKGKYKVFLKATKTGMLIEILDSEGIYYRQTVNPTIHMGLIRKSAAYVTDGIVFSEDENRFMYMADDPKPGLNMFKLKEKGVFRYRYEDIPGERLQSHTNPSIFIFDIPSKSLFRVQKPKEIFNKTRCLYAMPQFANREGTSLVCISMEMIDSFEMAFFTNYPKKLCYLTGLDVKNIEIDFLKTPFIKPQEVALNREGVPEAIVYFPKVSPDYKRCSYLFAEELMSASANVFGLRTFSLEDPSEKPETHIGIVKEDDPEFSGIQGMNYHLNSYCWLSSKAITFTTYLRQTTVLFEYRLDTKSFKKISSKIYLEGEVPFIIGALDDDTLLCKVETHVRNNNLFALKRQGDGKFKVTLLHKPLEETKKIFEETIEVDGIQSLWYGRNDIDTPLEKRGILIFAHGGPHNIFVNLFTPINYYMAKQGYTIINTNFTGSSGRGQNFMTKLHGRVDRPEWDEVYNSVQHLIKQNKADPNNVVYLGGSFAGALGIGLLQRYPNFVKAMSIFNPPLDGNALQFESVFPGLGKSLLLNTNVFGDPKEVYPLEECQKFNDHSVMFKEFNFTTEVVFFGGLRDTIVTRQSNRTFYKRCRENGMKIELFEYPDEEHFILIPKNTFDYYVKSVLVYFGLWKFS